MKEDWTEQRYYLQSQSYSSLLLREAIDQGFRIEGFKDLWLQRHEGEICQSLVPHRTPQLTLYEQQL